MKTKLPFSLFLAALILLPTLGCQQPKGSSFCDLDSLGAVATAWRYRNIDSLRTVAQRTLAMARELHNADAEAEALNHLAEERFQQMDFDSARYLADEVMKVTRNQVELLAADIMHMRIAQRTSQSEYFFHHRNSALRRIERISEEVGNAPEDLSTTTSFFTPHLQRRFATLVSDFHITSSTYFYYVDQQERALEEIRMAEPYSRLPEDTAQWLNYCYMRGSGELSDFAGEVQDEQTAAAVTRDEFDYLFRCYTLAKNRGYLFFEANALQSLASLYADSLRHVEVRNYKPHADDYFRAIFSESTATSLPESSSARTASLSASLPESRSARAVPPSESTASLSASLSESRSARAVRRGTSPLALAMALRAYKLFQRYDDLYQMACALRTLGELAFDEGDATLAIEYYTRALDCVNFHHRRFYTSSAPLTERDLLLPYDSLAPEPSVERQWMQSDSVLTVPEWIAGIRQQLSVAYSALGLKRESDFNRNIYLDLLDVTREDAELASRAEELRDITRNVRWHLILLVLLVLLVAVFGLLSRRIWYRRSERRLAALQQSLQSSVDSAQRKQEVLEEEREMLLEQQAATRLRILKDKKQNLEKRAKLQLVDAIMPYLDRIIHEVNRVKRTGTSSASSLDYITELTERIDLLNERLTGWIQMQQGQLSLQLSTFPVQPLFDAIRQGHYAFDRKGIRLEIPQKADEQVLSVKADRALTLFMLNTLADNARKFTPAGGTVRIEATVGEDSDGPYVELSVSDTGCGLTPEETDLILNHKVYDPAAIGTSDGKGFGFGLMNCKGIIEKYRKTSPFFRACQLGIESRVGQGSRFWFRLPRVVTLWLLGFCCCPSAADASPAPTRPSSHPTLAALADSVYFANLDGRYEDALSYAERALHRIDPQLSLRPLPFLPAGHAADIRLWHELTPEELTSLLGLRNEVAVAALALRDWPLYRYNNRIYTRLFKLSNQDATLEDYCLQMERTQANERVAIVLMLLLLMASLVLIYFLYVRPKRAYRRAEVEAQKRHYQQLLTEREAEQQRSRSDIEQANDEQHRRLFEANRLHVQNQIIDNCLSAIKHETMYFPGRIRQLAAQGRDSGQVDIETLAETVSYYKELFTLLSAQARDQVASAAFRRGRCRLSETLAALPFSYTADLQVHDETGDTTFLGDADLVQLLLQQLITYERESYEPTGSHPLTLIATIDSGFVRIGIANPSVILSDDALHQLFMSHVAPTSLLIARQIIREHDSLMGHPGCRIEASSFDGGHALWFTLPQTTALSDIN